MKNAQTQSPYQFGQSLAQEVRQVRSALRDLGHDDTCKGCTEHLLSLYDMPGFSPKDLEIHGEIQVESCEMN